METLPPGAFLEVSFLLEASQPRRHNGWFWYVVGGFLLLILISTYAGMEAPKTNALFARISGLALVALMVGIPAMTWNTVRRARVEQMQLEAIEELVQLRRWPQAAVILNGMLAQPARSDHGRIQALIFLAAVLARYGRFGDSITVHEYLLDHVNLDPGTEYGLRLGRAMALLQEDRLFDADRAINELRHAAGDADSAGLALVEIFRDVKTGHPAEAVEIFNAKLATLRQQLGHRCADAWALVARAYDLLERPAEAQEAYGKATLLAPEMELHRRYSEVAKLRGKYIATSAPPEMR
jgi:tetratricopeptide (TPR) repeat protein